MKFFSILEELTLSNDLFYCYEPNYIYSNFIHKINCFKMDFQHF